MKLIFTFLFFTSFVIQGQEQVFINAGEIGQGMLKVREGKCFVITPYHVVENSAGPIEIFEKSGRTGIAKIERLYASADLAILEVTRGKLNCEKWVEGQNIQMMLNSQSQGFFRTREEDGSNTIFSVILTNIGDEYITVQSFTSEQGITQGMSGSSLMINGVAIGMLLSVDTESNTGIVIRRNAIDRLTETFFKLSKSTTQIVDEQKKEIAYRVISNIGCTDLTCRINFSTFSKFKEDVKKIIFKSSDSNFKREINLNKLDLTDENIGTGYIPIIPGNSKIKVFVEFVDGSYSDISDKDALGKTRSKYLGKELRLFEKPENANIYNVYLGFNSAKGNEKLFFQCETPINTKAILYSFDGGGFYRQVPVNPYGEEQCALNYFKVDIPINTTSLKLSFEMADGSEKGPYIYKVEDVEEILKKSYKNIILETISSSIQCYRIPDLHESIDKNKDGKISSEESRKNRESKGSLNAIFYAKGIPETIAGPLIYCQPSMQLMFYDINKYNYALKGIKFGTQRYNLEDFIPLNLSLRDIMEGKRNNFRDYYKIWNKKFPINTKEINFQYVFFDDTVSPIIRINIEELGL